MASVYIETTIPSYYCETRSTSQIEAWQSATRDWWDHSRHHYDLYTSRFVLAELSHAPRAKARRAIELLDGVTVLDEPPGLQELVEYYIEHRLMPAESGGDAYHLALASMHAMTFLLTWNCRHLANANKTQHLTVLNNRMGVHVPLMTTPLTLVPEDEL